MNWTLKLFKMKEEIRKIAIWTAVLMVSCASTQAQRPGSPENGDAQDDRIRALRIAFMTEKLELTPAESEAFWAMHNVHEAQIEAIRERMKEITKEDGSAEVVENMRALRHEEVDLGAELIHQAADIIGYERANRLPRLEREFRKVLLSRMNRSGTGRVGGQRGGSGGGPVPGAGSW